MNAYFAAALTLLAAGCASAADLPVFESDRATDQWLREASAFYRTMATAVEARGGYEFRAWKGRFHGNVVVENGQRFIELNAGLAGGERVSVLVFELTNAFQAPRHEEIDALVRSGKISTAREFGFWHEAIEYDGLRLHRAVLEELDRAIGGIPATMLHWINPELKTLAEYELPFAFDYLKAQVASGHTAHYHEWFPKQAAGLENTNFAAATNAPPAAPRAPVQTLPNGVTISNAWPPRNEYQAGEPMDVPWLREQPPVIPIDGGRQLFVDDFLIEETTLTRVWHQPIAEAKNPVLRADREWEKMGDSPMAMPFSDGVWFDPSDGLFKCFYMAGYTRATALAVSKDGVVWKKPERDVKAGTNIVQPDVRDSSTVWLDLEDTDAQRRWKMFRSHGEDGRFGLSVHFSPDGVHWSPRALRTGSCGDRSTVFWNPFRRVWVFSLRHGWGQPRARRYWEMRDLLAGPQWGAITEPPMWVGADRFDLPREDLKVQPQLYNLDAVAYESLLVGLFTIWRGDLNIPPGRPKPNELHVAFSRDGFHWHRPPENERRAFLAPSEKQGDWNWGNVQSAGGGFLVVGDELWFYFSGRAGGAKRDAAGSMGLARLRRDGFASMDASSGEGTLTTRPLEFTGSHLFVNAAPGDGELRVELLDEAGNPIGPFTAAGCRPLKKDSTRARIQWEDASDLSALVGRTVKLRFHLSQGALYAFWISREPTGASGGYVAAGGPGFAGAQDGPAKKLARRSVIITTDCGAEMDDQWTVAQTALAPEVELLGIVTTHAPSLAAPAAETSARVAREVLAHLPLREAPPVHAGSNVPLTDRATPLRNAGVDFLLERSRGFSPRNRLAVFLLGAATDVASALLLDPTFADRVELIAMAFEKWPEGGDSWNAKNDVAAWQVVLDSRAPLVIGDATVTKRDLAVTRAQIAARAGPPGSAMRYLADLHTAWLDRDPPFVERVTGDRDMWPVWDSVTLAAMLGFTESATVPRPTLRDDLRFETANAAPERPRVKWITRVAADQLWAHFARNLEAADAQRAAAPAATK